LHKNIASSEKSAAGRLEIFILPSTSQLERYFNFFLTHYLSTDVNCIAKEKIVYLYQEVAVKLEPMKARHPQLLYESKLYKVLQGGLGIPHIR